MGSQQACQKPGYIRMARGDRVRVAPRTGGTQLQCSTLHQWRAINYPGRSQAFDEHGACRRPPRVRGEHMRLLAHEAHSDGSAPRARGTREPGGGAVGRRQDRPRRGRGDGPPGKHDPHAREAHVRQASPDAAGGPGAACALAGRRSQVPALKAQAAADRR